MAVFFNRFFALFLFIFIFLFFFLIYIFLFIKIGNPVIFKQPRSGRYRKIFSLYKKYLNNININFNTNNDVLKNGCWATVLNIRNISKKKIKSIFKNLILRGYFARPFFYPISSLPAFKDKQIRSRVKYIGDKNSFYLLKKKYCIA